MQVVFERLSKKLGMLYASVELVVCKFIRFNVPAY